MSDLLGNHIVGFPTRRFIYCRIQITVNSNIINRLIEYISSNNEFFFSCNLTAFRFSKRNNLIYVLKEEIIMAAHQTRIFVDQLANPHSVTLRDLAPRDLRDREVEHF